MKHINKMNVEQAKKLVIEVINENLEKGEANEDSKLLEEDLLDSMTLVEVCLSLEDVADNHGFEFDWTSETALSKSKSMFRSVTSLAEEFSSQSEN